MSAQDVYALQKEIAREENEKEEKERAKTVCCLFLSLLLHFSCVSGRKQRCNGEPLLVQCEQAAPQRVKRILMPSPNLAKLIRRRNDKTLESSLQIYMQKKKKQLTNKKTKTKKQSVCKVTFRHIPPSFISFAVAVEAVFAERKEQPGSVN